MSLEEEKNKALVRRFWEAVARGDIDAIDELLAVTSSITARLPDKSLAAKATSSRSPNNTLPSLMFAPRSRTR